jgi:hypothetical protein
LHGISSKLTVNGNSVETNDPKATLRSQNIFLYANKEDFTKNIGSEQIVYNNMLYEMLIWRPLRVIFLYANKEDFTKIIGSEQIGYNKMLYEMLIWRTLRVPYKTFKGPCITELPLLQGKCRKLSGTGKSIETIDPEAPLRDQITFLHTKKFAFTVIIASGHFENNNRLYEMLI